MKPYLPILWPFLIGIALIAITLFGPSGLRDLRELRSTKAELNEKILAVIQENEELEKEIEALSRFTPYLELMIRTRLGWIKDSERVIFLPLPPDPAAP